MGVGHQGSWSDDARFAGLARVIEPLRVRRSSTVIHWRDRFAGGGLENRERSGRPRRVDEAEVVLATLTRRRSGWG